MKSLNLIIDLDSSLSVPALSCICLETQREDISQRQDLIRSDFPLKRLNILTSSQSHET